MIRGSKYRDKNEKRKASPPPVASIPRCPDCKMKIRGANHNEGKHHKGMKS